MNNESWEIINELKEERIKKNITMNQLAKQIGISHTTISRIEKGEMTPTLDMILLYANALGYDLKLEKSFVDSNKISTNSKKSVF